MIFSREVQPKSLSAIVDNILQIVADTNSKPLQPGAPIIDTAYTSIATPLYTLP